MILKFETNLPQVIRLKSAQGAEKEGQYGIQYMHSLLPEGVVYLQPIVEKKLQDLGVKDGDSVEICKKEVREEGKKPRIEWAVSKVEAETSSTTAKPNGNGSAHSASTNPAIPMQIPMDTALSMYLIAAGRATREAEQVLGKEGGAVRFDSRDIAALATTMFIASAKWQWIGPMEPKAAQAAVADAKIQKLTNGAIHQPAPSANLAEYKQNIEETRKQLRELADKLGKQYGITPVHLTQANVGYFGDDEAQQRTPDEKLGALKLYAKAIEDVPQRAELLKTEPVNFGHSVANN